MKVFETLKASIYYNFLQEDVENKRGMDFVSSDIFGLIARHNSDSDSNYPIEFIYIHDIKYEEDEVSLDEVKRIVGLFAETFKDKVIVYRAQPTMYNLKDTFDDPDKAKSHIRKPIVGLDLVEDGKYEITNHCTVWEIVCQNNPDEDCRKQIVPVVQFDDDTRVGLTCKDLKIRFYSISVLMLHAFESAKEPKEHVWEDTFNKLCEDAAYFGFDSINDYCGLEYSDVFIYPNDMGNKIKDAIESLDKEFEEECKNHDA